MKEIEIIVQEKIDNDVDFQASIVDLSDDEKQQAVNDKKTELIKTEFESLGKKVQENEQKFKDQQIRAAKAEEEAKKAKVGQIEQEKKSGLSQKDVIYLAKSDIHEDDIDEVVEYAQLKKVPVADAHKFMKPILKEREEERKTAQATQIKGGVKGSSKPTPEDILEKAQKGDLPESDEGIAQLAEARRSQERARLGK